LWVVVCLFTSMAYLVPLTMTITASELAFLYMSNVIKLHGLPEAVVSDRDSKFTSVFWCELHRLLNTKLQMSTAFHPQTDGKTKHTIRSVSQILRSVVAADQTDWALRIPMVEFAMNSAISSSTGFAPFELNYGYMPKMLTTVPTLEPPVPKGV